MHVFAVDTGVRRYDELGLALVYGHPSVDIRAMHEGFMRVVAVDTGVRRYDGLGLDRGYPSPSYRRAPV